MKRQNNILRWVQAEKKRSETLERTLFRLLKDKKKMNSLLQTVTRNPRDNKAAFRRISASFSTREKKQDWLSIYAQLYSDYMNAQLKKAHRIEDILRIIPNLLPWTLQQRFDTIQVGSVPLAFGSEKDFLSVMERINSSGVVKKFKRIKKLECHLPDFKKAFPAVREIDWFDFSARSHFLRTLLHKECGKPFTVRCNNRAFRVQFLCNPFSHKMVFKIQAPDGQTFIIKESPYNFLNMRNDRIRKEHENMAIRADSTYSDAMLEFYLKLNRCLHAPDILYYHFDYEVALYTCETGHLLVFDDSVASHKDFYSFNTKVVPDSSRLGVYINDINAGNFLVSDKDGIVKIIDIGHASFANPLTPGVPGLTFTLGNLCGQDYISINGVLDVEDI